MSRVLNGFRLVLGFLAGVGVLAYGVAALVTVADILGRQVGLPINGVVDLVQLFVIAGAWLVMPYAFMTGAHVGVDFLVRAMPAGVETALRALGAAAAVGLLGLMFWQGFATYQMRTMFGDSSQQLGIPIAWYWRPLLLGLAMSLAGAALAFLSPPERRAAE